MLQKVKKITVAIIAPFPPPYGGMAVQAEKLYKRIKESGIQSFYVKTNLPFPQYLSFFEKIKGIRTFIRFILFFLKILEIRKATIVHIFGASNVYFFLVVCPSLLMAKIMRKKVVLNYRGGEAEKFLNKWGFLAIPFLKRADVIAVPSNFLKEVFERFVEREVLILPNIADIELFKYRERSTLRAYIIVSRQLERYYNIDCALEAFKVIKEAYPGARLKIAGKGSQENRLKRLSEEMALKDVDFLGALSHDKLSRVYDECDIMINPSKVDNFPGSILEAFACGLPVVSTRVGGIPFMVKEGENGILVDPDDPMGLANGVIKLLENPDLAIRLSRNGRGVAERHAWENVREILFKFYGTT